MQSRLILTVILILLTGCPYTFSGQFPGHIKTVIVPVFENQTLEATLSEEVTTAIIDRLVRENRVSVVQGTADAALNGSVTGYEERVSGISSGGTADEYVVVVTTQMELRDNTKNKELWKEEAIRGVGTYRVGSTDSEVASTEEEARERAIEQIVDIVISRTFEGW